MLPLGFHIRTLWQALEKELIYTLYCVVCVFIDFFMWAAHILGKRGRHED
jgi:hypothetical protein